MRPQSLAEVSSISQRDQGSFATACDEFCDAFYLMFPENVSMQRALDPVPELIGDAHMDAWIGAIGEHLAMRWKLITPPWTRRQGHFALTVPEFMPPSLVLRKLLIAESPPAFRSRLIFTTAEPLLRARFPKGVERVLMPW